MPAQIFRSVIVLVCLLLPLLIQPVYAKKMYKMEDEQGNTLFSDQVEPEQSKYRRELLNGSGRVIDITEKAKTKEQMELDKRLQVLRQEEERLISHQKIRDNALLNTFHSKEELYAGLKIKMDMFDAQRRAIESNSKHLVEQLKNQQKEAAGYERNGQKVPQKLLDDIKSTQVQIEQTYVSLVLNDDKRNQTLNEYKADIARFLFLTQSAKKPIPVSKIPSLKEANALGLFYCENDHQCNKAWEIARVFVNAHSTTLPDVYNDKLIMNRPPATDLDISLSLSRIAVTDEDYQLFLDIHCQDSMPGRQLCSSEKVKEIRFSFRSYVNDALSRSAQ